MRQVDMVPARYSLDDSAKPQVNITKNSVFRLNKAKTEGRQGP